MEKLHVVNETHDGTGKLGVEVVSAGADNVRCWQLQQRSLDLLKAGSDRVYGMLGVAGKTGNAIGRFGAGSQPAILNTNILRRLTGAGGEEWNDGQQ